VAEEASASHPGDEVVDLLLAEVGRDRSGRIESAPVWAAVVGVERVALVSGASEAGELRLLLQGQAGGATLVEVERAWARIDEAVARDAQGRSADSGTAHRDAGHHSVTQDAGRLRAAIRAAHRTFEHEPYYRARYADRGARFAGSDSAWLVTLGELPADGCIGQVAWLSRVLAARGMPAWLLERHLGDLSQALVDECGAGAAGTLPQAATALATTRRTVLADGVLADAGATLAAETGAPEPLAGAAALALAAAADVATGVTRSYRPCLDWLTDPGRCEPAAASWMLERAAALAPEGSVSAGRSRAGSPGLRS
jgi:hypothetical protein